MLINEVVCPSCGQQFIVDRALWEIGTVRLRCGKCETYFLPQGSPKSRTVESATRSSVPIKIWEPEGR